MLQAWLSELQSSLSTPRRLIGLALLRICLASVALISELAHIREYNFLWGDNGMVPWGTFMQQMHEEHSFSVYALTPLPWAHALLYGLGIMATASLLIGWHTRISAFLFAVFTWSLYERNFLLLDGGDNLTYLLMFWLIFTDSGARLSIDAEKRSTKTLHPLAALLHNTALMAMIAEVMLLYTTSALAKLSGTMWQNGTAIYYVLRTGEFNLSQMTPYLWHSATVVTLLTYATMAFQLLWPTLIWTRRWKLPVAFGALLLHSSIGYFMGLMWFSMVMIGAEAIMFSDGDFARYGDRLRDLWLYLQTTRRQFSSGRTPSPAASPRGDSVPAVH